MDDGFKKFTAKILFSTDFPQKHTKNYTDFPIKRKFDNSLKKYFIDDEWMKNYFELSFQNQENIFNPYPNGIKGDDVEVNQEGRLTLTIKRYRFYNIDISKLRYAKVELFYDKTLSETFYCWITQKNLVLNDLTFLNFELIVDYIPSNYESIKEQLIQGLINRRSFIIYKNQQISLKEEKNLRLERQIWNIECDDLCSTTEALFYNHHFKSEKRILGRLIFSAKVPEGCDTKKKCLDRPANLKDLKCENPPCSISLSPMFVSTSLDVWITKSQSTTQLYDFINFNNTNERFNWLGGANIYTMINDQRPVIESINDQYMIILLFETNEKGLNTDTKFLPLPFELSINEFQNQEFKYNEFKNVIPHHFQQFHTKYIIRNNQDDVNEIPTNLVFLDGFNLNNNSKWIDDINLHVSYRVGSDNSIYDVYWKNSSFPKKYEFIQTNNKVILSFNNWMKIYWKETDWEAYLRSNYEQRKIAQQSIVKDYLLNTTKIVLGGAYAGYLASAKIAATPWLAATGLPGWLIGAGIGLITFLGSTFINELSGTSERQKMEARERDLQNSFSPPVPSEVGANYFTIFTKTFDDNNELNIIHPLGLFVTEVIGFAWEWKYEFTDYQTLGNASKKLLNNLINYGEKCSKYVTEFNLFDFIVNNKTDQDKFYIHFESAIPKNDIYYSNIFANFDTTLCELLRSGIRFHFEED